MMSVVRVYDGTRTILDDDLVGRVYCGAKHDLTSSDGDDVFIDCDVHGVLRDGEECGWDCVQSRNARELWWLQDRYPARRFLYSCPSCRRYSVYSGHGWCRYTDCLYQARHVDLALVRDAQAMYGYTVSVKVELICSQ